MAKSTNLNFTQNVNFAGATYTNSDAAATVKTLYTAGTNDAVVKSITIRSDETANARVIDLIYYDGTTNYSLGAVNVPVNSGFSGAVASVDALSSTLFPGLPMDATGKRVLPMKAGHLLKVNNQTQVTSGKTVTISALVEEY